MSPPSPTPPIDVQGCDHVAIAVPDLEAACRLFRDRFGLAVGAPKEVPAQKVRIAYVELGQIRLELMEPLGAGSPLASFLGRHPAGGLHHIALTTADAGESHKAARAAGLRTAGQGVTTGHHGRELFFLHPSECLGTLVEIETQHSGSGPLE